MATSDATAPVWAAWECRPGRGWSRRTASRQWSVESGDAARAVLVDELIGKQGVVIQEPGTTFRNRGLLAGAKLSWA